MNRRGFLRFLGWAPAALPMAAKAIAAAQGPRLMLGELSIGQSGTWMPIGDIGPIGPIGDPGVSGISFSEMRFLLKGEWEKAELTRLFDEAASDDFEPGLQDA